MLLLLCRAHKEEQNRLKERTRRCTLQPQQSVVVHLQSFLILSVSVAQIVEQPQSGSIILGCGWLRLKALRHGHRGARLRLALFTPSVRGEPKLVFTSRRSPL